MKKATVRKSEAPPPLKGLLRNVTDGEAAAEWVDITSLKPWANNPRKNEKTVKRVIKSIERFGFGAPLLVRKSNREVIGGHTRLMAAAELGITRVPVRFMDLTEKEAHALALADNRIQEFSDWDDDLLTTVVNDLKDDVTLVETAGFKINDFVESSIVEEEEPPPPPTKPMTQDGDLWILGDHKLICGDSFAPEVRERILGKETVDCVVMDPPYAIYGSSTGIGTDIADDKMVRPFFENIFRIVIAHLKEFGHAYVCTDWRSWAALWEGAKRAQMSVKNCIVWDKGNYGMGGMYGNAHEFIGFFARLPPPKAMKSTTKKGQRAVTGSVNIYRHKRVTGAEREHNAAKPVEMFQHFIMNSTDEGETVVDYFGGSGTTMIACEQSKRKARIFEMEPKYCDVIVKRWERVTGRKAQRA